MHKSLLIGQGRGASHRRRGFLASIVTASDSDGVSGQRCPAYTPLSPPASGGKDFERSPASVLSVSAAESGIQTIVMHTPQLVERDSHLNVG